MTASVITREEMVQESFTEYVRAGLEAAGFTSDVLDFRDAFPTPSERATQMDKTQVCAGFNFDDGGRQVELGSDLRRRIYTLEIWVFGKTDNFGRNVANNTRKIIEGTSLLVPLLDIRQQDRPTIDQLIIEDDRGAAVTRQIARDPMPWDMHVFTVTVKVEDTYSPGQFNAL